VAAGLAALGAGLIAFGLLSLGRTPPRRRLAFAVRLPPSAAARASLTGLTALAVVLLWPSATFGQGSQDWQVVEYYDSDAVGSIRMVTDAQGQVVARHDFLPFGEELNPQHEPPDKRLYTGQERDFETGQDYFGYRQLRADLGRFLAPDPITLVPRVVGAQGVNSYAYVRNNPLRLIDPNGLDAIDLDDVEPLDLYAPGDWGEDPGDTLASDGALNDSADADAGGPDQGTPGGVGINPVTGGNAIKDEEIRTEPGNPNVGQYGAPRPANAYPYHTGVDIVAPVGTPLLAPMSGTVSKGKDPQGGYWIRVTGTVDGHTVAMHMSHLRELPAVRTGARVEQGQAAIAVSGNTGNASRTTPHVHFSVWVDGSTPGINDRNPQMWLAEHQRK
jgi:RHS repeat-associated protein